MKCKKITLWMFVCGMICMPVQQIDAGISNNTLKAMIAMGIGAGSFFSYILYQNYSELCKDYFRFQIASEDVVDNQEEKDVKFYRLIDYLTVQFKDEKIAADFDIRILALYIQMFSPEESKVFVDVIKHVAHAQAAPVAMKHVVKAILILQSNFDDEEFEYQEQSLLDKAYHQAAHAVAVIELMNPDVALYNVSLSLSDGIDTGFIYVSVVDHVTHERNLKFIENSILYYLAGGIGQQLNNVSPLPRSNRYGDISQYKDRSDYQYIEMVTRTSVQNDLEIAQEMAATFLRINSLKAGHMYDETSIVDPKLLWNYMVSAYFKVYAILKNRTDKIEKIAQLLVTQGSVSADEAYAICCKQRPLFYFEKE